MEHPEDKAKVLPPLTVLQMRVMNVTHHKLKNEPWYNGVRTENMLTDDCISKEGFRKAVSNSISETMFYDCPVLEKVNDQCSHV